MRIAPSLPCRRASAWPRVRQEVAGKVCTEEVASCDSQEAGILSCHSFYTCDENGDGYKCQNPKKDWMFRRYATCSETYFFGQNKASYKCPSGTKCSS